MREVEYQKHSRRRRACWCKGGYGGVSVMIGPQVSGWLVRLFTEVESSASPSLATAGIVGCKNMALAMK